MAGCCPHARFTFTVSSRQPPPTRPMNSRRVVSSMGSPPEPARPAYRSLSMLRKHPLVFGVDLNRPEWLPPRPPGGARHQQSRASGKCHGCFGRGLGNGTAPRPAAVFWKGIVSGVEGALTKATMGSPGGDLGTAAALGIEPVLSSLAGGCLPLVVALKTDKNPLTRTATNPIPSRVRRTANRCRRLMRKFLQTHEYKYLTRWTKEIGERPAVKRGRMVNRASGRPEEQLRERHDASDFATKTQDRIDARGEPNRNPS